MPADELVQTHLAAVGPPSTSGLWADDGAPYAFSATIDLRSVEPYVGYPHQLVGNAAPVSAFPATSVDQCFIGSCANGQLDDLEAAARILRGRKVAAGVRLVITPASQTIALEAVRRGFVETFLEAGAVVPNATCGACFGYHLGLVGDGEVCLTASTR